MQATSQGSGKHILLIDEEPVILRLLEFALSEEGFMAYCSSSPERAIEICKAHPLRIVLADVDFLGEAGLRLLASMKALRPDIRICLITAGLPTYADGDLRRLGVTLCFSKPMDLAELVLALEQQLQE